MYTGLRALTHLHVPLHILRKQLQCKKRTSTIELQKLQCTMCLTFTTHLLLKERRHTCRSAPTSRDMLLLLLHIQKQGVGAERIGFDLYNF